MRLGTARGDRTLDISGKNRVLLPLSYRSMVGPEGVEPPTAELKVRCSTAELRSHGCTRNRWVLSSSSSPGGSGRNRTYLPRRAPGLQPGAAPSAASDPLKRRKATRFPRWPSRHRCRCRASSPGASGIFLAETLEATRDFPDQGAPHRIQRCR